VYPDVECVLGFDPIPVWACAPVAANTKAAAKSICFIPSPFPLVDLRADTTMRKQQCRIPRRSVDRLPEELQRAISPAAGDCRGHDRRRIDLGERRGVDRRMGDRRSLRVENGKSGFYSFQILWIVFIHHGARPRQPCPWFENVFPLG
jgi:hypothetical protein